MSSLLAVQNAELISFDPKKIELIKSTVARDLTDNEFEFFIAVARQRGLDPILNQIHAVVRGTGDKAKMTIQVAIDGFRLIAARTGDFAGIDAPKFLYDGDGNPTRCQVTVYRMVQGQRCAFVASTKWTEFVPEGTMAFMWKKMPEVMLAKVTEAQALRKAFPADLSGLYEDAELHQADRDVTPPPNNQPPKQAVPSVESKPASRPQTQNLVSPPTANVVTNHSDVTFCGGKWNTKTFADIVNNPDLGWVELQNYMHYLEKPTTSKAGWISHILKEWPKFKAEYENNHKDASDGRLDAIADKFSQDDFDFAFPKGAVK